MIRYILVLSVGVFVSTFLMGCSGPVTFTPDSVVMIYGYSDDTYKLEYRFTKEEAAAICEKLNSYRVERIRVMDATWYLCRIEISATDSMKQLNILQGNRLCVYNLDDRDEESYRIIVDGFFDLIKKRLYALEIEYLGEYPLETISGNILSSRLDLALERACEELGLTFWADSGDVNALRRFQEWYKENKDKIKWDEKQNKYIVTE